MLNVSRETFQPGFGLVFLSNDQQTIHITTTIHHYHQSHITHIAAFHVKHFRFLKVLGLFFENFPEQQKTAFQIAEMRFLAYVTIYRNRIMWAFRPLFPLFFCLLYSCVFGLIFDCSEFGSIAFCCGLFFNLILLVIRYSHCNDVIVVSLHSEYVHTACCSSLT